MLTTKAVLLPQMQPGLRLLNHPDRMCGRTAVDWKLVAAVVRGETTEILLLWHDLLLILWYDSFLHWNEWINELMYVKQTPSKEIT